MREPRPSVVRSLLSGLRGRCPRCGRGRLFEGYLAVADQCDVCALTLSEHDSGDGPAVAAIFILGFGVIGLAWAVERLVTPPLWIHAALWIPLTVAGTLLLLRPLKGLTVATQYCVRSVDEPTQPGGT